jgi:hypothetical protein
VDAWSHLVLRLRSLIGETAANIVTRPANQGTMSLATSCRIVRAAIASAPPPTSRHQPILTAPDPVVTDARIDIRPDGQTILGAAAAPLTQTIRVSLPDLPLAA